MTLAKDGAESLIAQFGETVTIVPQSSQEPVDSNDPIYFQEGSTSESNHDEKVRLYTSVSDEMMTDYGLSSEEADAMMYDTSEIASEGDRVKYGDRYEWVIEAENTNQIGNGPYIFVYAMRNV